MVWINVADPSAVFDPGPLARAIDQFPLESFELGVERNAPQAVQLEGAARELLRELSHPVRASPDRHLGKGGLPDGERGARALRVGLSAASIERSIGSDPGDAAAWRARVGVARRFVDGAAVRRRQLPDDLAERDAQRLPRRRARDVGRACRRDDDVLSSAGCCSPGAGRRRRRRRSSSRIGSCTSRTSTSVRGCSAPTPQGSTPTGCSPRPRNGACSSCTSTSAEPLPSTRSSVGRDPR